MTNTTWLFVAIIVTFVFGWSWGQWFGCTRYFRKRHVGTIVYVDKQEETVTIQFNSEEAMHKMKNFDCVVFNVKSLD